MRKVCEVYLVSSSATDERGVELTFPVSQYEMMDAFEQIHTKSPGDVYWQVDEFHCFDYLAPHMDELKQYRGVDLVFGGPPCQGGSVAGKWS